MFEDDDNNDVGGANVKNYIEALHDYFKLKSKYESKLRSAQKKIFVKEKNKKESRKKILELKPTCVKCSRPVGTIFSSVENKFVAMCGDRTLPCSLDIQIYRGDYDNITFLLELFKHDKEDLENNIILQKLDTLFEYTNESQSISSFKKAIKAYNGDSVIYKEILEKYNSLYDNKEKQTLISLKKEEIYLAMDKSRSYLEEYKKTHNPEFLTLCVEVYVKEIQPSFEALRTLKHEIMELYSEEYKKGTITHILFTYPVLLEKIDSNVGEPPRVIKFVV